MDSTKELELDLNELRELLAQAKRDHVKSAIGKLVNEYEGMVKVAEASKVKKIETASPAKDAIIYSSISTYSWEQEEGSVKVYITGLNGVGALPKENIVVDFATNGFDLKVKGLDGKNYRLKIYPLNKEILPGNSRFSIKTNMISITMAKNGKEHWDDIKEKKKPFKNPSLGKEKGKGKEEDPQASLMNMMKEMYDSGDDEMKKVIAQSWMKAQEDTMSKKM
eukprot:TRINITY_DN1548_c0_g1_i1.p1 TRINITY_DN1548_c0_g1~~TRINITY_DN1548_c0_g1_i1.p1  ORF type:complete len:222 (+),score=58.95 TRINITY_DN1548_c0_g1_i1:209-874(+)